MRLDHSDYIKLVTKTYFKRRKEPFFVLPRSTPANISRACLRVFHERYRREDEQILKNFFGPAKSEQQLFEIMDDFDINKFRPLDMYLKKEGRVKTDDKNIELLAWLIDFKHRPYVYDMQVILSDEELTLLEEEEGIGLPKPGSEEEETNDEELSDNQTKESSQANNNKPVSPSEDEEGQTATVGQENIEENENTQVKQGEPVKPAKEEPQKGAEDSKKPEKPHTPFGAVLGINDRQSNRRKVVIILLALIISTAGGYGIWQQARAKDLSYGITNAGCMYWSYDHYEPIDCNEKRRGTLVLPLDKEVMKNLRMVTKDTISNWSVGKLYYIKDRNNIKYYTAGGSYPEDTSRSLKILSQYIYDTYQDRKGTSGKDLQEEQNSGVSQ